MNASRILKSALTCAGLATAAQAQINVSGDITVSTTWTANNVYNLTGQVYVTNGATLTIEAGTVIASAPTVNGAGALCITRGSQIFVQGTQDQPVIMTSTNDTATWIGGDPKTGTWREAANEWGNLTICGQAYMNENQIGTNLPAPDAGNYGIMEGLTEGFPGDTRVRYGGGNDDDDSGTISYLSLRYGGRVVGLGTELNGLSLGALGRNTDIHHVEIMNNVDDGIEIWGGTVNLKYFSIWNIGDDSLDVDQGWRGKAQFGLIVQGHSVDAAQGSGVGDNVFEMDGCEDSFWQPVTTSTIYNCTVVGQPLDGDHATAWRDNARVQLRNCVFMDIGERLVSFDNSDGDTPIAGAGYGASGTLSWANTWTTPFTATSTVNPPANPALFYTVQTSGNLIEIRDSVFFRNLHASAQTEANARGVFAPANDNVNNSALVLDAQSPIVGITRGPLVVRGGKNMLPVTFLDPRPKNEALTSVAAAPADGFFTPAQYRGAFAPGQQSWLCKWTASFAFGFTPECDPGQSICAGDGSLTDHTTPCPCANNGAAGNGCAHSFSAAGANLDGSGIVALDTTPNQPNQVILTSTNSPVSSFTLFMQHSAAGDTAFHDGVLCAGGTLTRLRGRNAVAGAATFPNNAFANDSTLTLSSRGGVVVGSGVTRYYAAFYRNASTTFCPPATANVTNGYKIVW